MCQAAHNCYIPDPAAIGVSTALQKIPDLTSQVSRNSSSYVPCPKGYANNRSLFAPRESLQTPEIFPSPQLGFGIPSIHPRSSIYLARRTRSRGTLRKSRRYPQADLACVKAGRDLQQASYSTASGVVDPRDIVHARPKLVQLSQRMAIDAIAIGRQIRPEVGRQLDQDR